MYSQILELAVRLSGIEEVDRGLDDAVSKIEQIQNRVNGVAGGIALVAASITMVAAGIKEAIPDERYLAIYEGLTGSVTEAARQMQIVDQIAMKGVFQEQAVQNAIVTMDKYGMSVSKNISLVEKLGALNGSIEGSAELVGMISSGRTEGLTRRLMQFGIGPNKLKEAGLQMDGSSIKGSADEILSALDKIASKYGVLNKLENTTAASIEKIKYQFGELVQTIGDPFLKPFSAVITYLSEIFRWIKDLNIVTDGWVGKFAVGGMFIVGLVKIVTFLKEIAILEKVIAIWAGVRNAMQAGPALLQGLANIIKFLFSMRAIETVLLGIETARAFLAAAFAAAIGNIPGALAAIGLIAAAGIGAAAAINGVNNYRANQASGGGGGGSQNRPIRRDDWQRVYDRAYGEAFTG